MLYKLFKLSDNYLTIEDIDKVFYFVLLFNGNHDYAYQGDFHYSDGIFYLTPGYWSEKFMKWQ